MDSCQQELLIMLLPGNVTAEQWEVDIAWVSTGSRLCDLQAV